MFGDDSTTKCSECYSASLPQFPSDNLIVHGNLTANTEYHWFLETTQGTVYQGTATTNGDGDIEIPISEFPDGLMAAAAGRFIIYFKMESEMPDGDVQTLTLPYGYATAEYDCITLTFYDCKGTFTDTEIG